MNETREFDPSDRLIEIADEFAQCVRNRESPSVEDFANRYPDEADEIRRYLPILLAMDKQTAAADDYGDTAQAEVTLPIPVEQLPLGISRYYVKRLIGLGNMGAVYEARDLELDRTVALKMPQLQQAKRRAVERFYREARAMATVDHANICSIYDVGEFQEEDLDEGAPPGIVGRPYLTMAFVEGTVLSDLMLQRSWTPDEAAELIRKIAAALDIAHAAGVVHRDIKPGNIVIDAQGEPILMDFGLARRDQPEEIEITIDGQIIGSPAYMSPEQINCRRKVGPPTDIYSLGIVLYELVCGKRPFTGSRLTLLRDVCWTQPPNPSEVRRGVDSAIESVCLKAIAKDPADRYVSAGDFAKDLQAYLDGTSSEEMIAGSSRARRSQALINWPMVAGIGACLCVAVLLTWPLWGSKGASSAANALVTPVDVAPAERVLPIIPAEQIRAPLHRTFYNHFRFRRHETREPDLSAAYQELFAQWGITPDETSAKDLQLLLDAQEPETRAEILIGLESWLSCVARDTEDVPAPWLRSLLEFNHADHTPIRSAILELDSARLSVLVRQFAVEHYDPRIPVIWSIYLRWTDRQNAKRLLSQAYEAFPDDLWVNAASGLRKKENANHVGAVPNFEAALAIEESPELQTHLGLCLLNQKKKAKPEEAVVLLRRAVELDPEYGMAQFGLGKALLLAAENEDAESNLRKAIQSKCSAMNQAQHFHARALVRLGRIEEGMQTATKLIESLRGQTRWRNIMRFAKDMLVDLEQREEAAIYQRFRFCNEYFTAATRAGAAGILVGAYANRVLSDLESMALPPSDWRVKKMQRIVSTIDKRKRKRPMVFQRKQ